MLYDRGKYESWCILWGWDLVSKLESARCDSFGLQAVNNKRITVPEFCSVVAEKHKGGGAVRKAGRNGGLCCKRCVCIETRHQSSLFTLVCLCRQGCKGENRIKLGKKSHGLFSFLPFSFFFFPQKKLQLPLFNVSFYRIRLRWKCKRGKN